MASICAWTDQARADGSSVCGSTIENRTLGLGGYRLVSLAEAREKAFMNRKIARSGGDPRTERHKVRDMPTFAEAAARVLEQQRPGWRSAKHAKAWVTSLRVYAFPQLGHQPVGEITTADVLAVLTPIWHDKHATARLVRQRIGAVMKWAVAMGLRPDNPASDVLDQALGRQHVVIQHMRALPHSKVAGAMETVRKSNAYPATKLAFEFMVLTAARSGEVRSAHWDESGIDLEAREWTVPGERMKAQRPHRVPLSGRAMEILSEARPLGGGGLVFPSPEGRVFSGGTLPTLLRRLGIAAVPHGFRSSFRDWAAECTDTPPCGHGGGVGARGPQQGGGSLRAFRPVRAQARPDGRVGRVSGHRASRPGGRSQPLRREPLRPDPRPIHGWLMTP